MESRRWGRGWRRWSWPSPIRRSFPTGSRSSPAGATPCLITGQPCFGNRRNGGDQAISCADKADCQDPSEHYLIDYQGGDCHRADGLADCPKSIASRVPYSNSAGVAERTTRKLAEMPETKNSHDDFREAFTLKNCHASRFCFATRQHDEQLVKCPTGKPHTSKSALSGTSDASLKVNPENTTVVREEIADAKLDQSLGRARFGM